MGKLLSTKVTVTRNGNDVVAMLKKFAKEYGDASVTVGVQGNEASADYEGTGVTVAQVALWNEFGTPNAKHPTPERSFIRSTVHENEGRIEAWRKEAVANVLTKGWSVEKALSMIGLRLQLLIQNKIKSNVPPPNAPWTLERKEALNQGTDTLMATKKLLQSVTFKVHLDKSGDGGASAAG